MTSRLLSNRSLRATYVWFKRPSIPFAACGNEDCGNYGVNVFEHSGHCWSDGKSKSVRAVCPKCKEVVCLGEPLRLHRTHGRQRKLDRRLTTIFKHARAGLGIRTLMLLLDDLYPNHYLNVLRILGNRMRDYQNYCNGARLPEAVPPAVRPGKRRQGTRAPGQPVQQERDLADRHDERLAQNADGGVCHPASLDLRPDDGAPHPQAKYLVPACRVSLCGFLGRKPAGGYGRGRQRHRVMAGCSGTPLSFVRKTSHPAANAEAIWIESDVLALVVARRLAASKNTSFVTRKHVRWGLPVIALMYASLFFRF